MIFRRIYLIVSILLLPFFGLAETSTLNDSLYLEKVANNLINKLQRQIEINKANDSEGKSSENSYLIFGETDDSFFKIESINQSSGKPVWNEQHTGITQVKEALTAFNSRPSEPVKYYVLVASIYNFYNFDEVMSKNPDWSKMPGYKDVKENKPKPYAETNTERSKTFFFKVLKSKIENLAGNNIVHIAASFYIPLPQKTPTDKKYAIFHHQAVSFANLESYQSAAIQLALGSAEKTINSIKEKEAWLSSAVDFAINQYKNAKAPDSGSGYSTNLESCTATSLEAKIQTFKDAFEKDFRMKPSLTSELLSKTENYFIYKPGGFDAEHDQEYTELDNKINFLYKEWLWQAASNNTSDETLFYTVVQDIGCKLDNPSLISNLSQKIYEQSSLKGKKVILISVPYYHVSISPDRYEIGKASIFDNTGLLNTNLAFTTSNTVPGIIQSVYKQIKKPYHRYDVKMDVEGSVTHTERMEESVLGYNSINEVNLWIKPEFYEFSKLKYPGPNCDACVDIIPDDERGFKREPNETKHQIEIIKYTARRNAILNQANSTPNNWQLYEPEVKLKEWCIDGNEKILSYAKQQFEQEEFQNWLDNAGILLGASEVDQACLANFNAMAVVDPVVYGVIDAASFIPLVDEVAEGAGLLYASARGDGDNAVIYLVGLGLPAGATVAIKATYKTGKMMIKGVLYVVDNGKVYLEKVITNTDELAELLRTLLHFKNTSTAIPENRVLEIVDIINASDAQVKSQIEQIAKRDISDASKLDEISKLTRVPVKLADQLTGSLRTTYDDLIKQGYEAVEEGGEILFKKDNILVAKIADDALQIKIPHGNGWAKQSVNHAAISGLEQIKNGEPLYRIGTSGQSAAGEAQYWAFENPFLISDINAFANKYGIPQQNLETGSFFVEIGKPKEGIPFITREAPSVGGNPGGSIEVVVPTNGVGLETFHTIKLSDIAEANQDDVLSQLLKTQPQKFIDGKKFEATIAELIDGKNSSILNDLSQKAGITLQQLDQYSSIKQLQIRLPNEGYVILDNAWVKQVNVGGQSYFEIIANECKLSTSSPWTKRQQELVDLLNGATVDFTTRSARPDVSSIIPQNSKVKFKAVVQTVGNGTPTGGYTISKVF